MILILIKTFVILQAQYLICEKLREEGYASGIADIRLIVEIMVPASQVGRIQALQ